MQSSLYNVKVKENIDIKMPFTNLLFFQFYSHQTKVVK